MLRLLLVLSFWIAAGPVRAELPTVRIGIAVDGPYEWNEVGLSVFRMEIRELLDGEFEALFPDDKLIVADWTVRGAQAAVDQLLDDPQVDVVLALGVIASNYVCRKEKLEKPVFAPYVLDAEMQGLPMFNGTSGVKNLNYLSFPSQFRRDLKAFLEVVPFKRLALLINGPLSEAIPQLRQNVERVGREFGIDVIVLPVYDSVDDVIAALPQDAEAVYVGIMIHLNSEDYNKLIQTLIERRLPSFALVGKMDVQRGLLMCLASENPYERIARRIALNLQRVLLGEDPGSIPVAYSPGQRLSINMTTAGAIGVYPPWSALTEADLIGEKPKDVRRHLTLPQAVREAIKVNLDLAARDHNVAAGREEISNAWARLKPQLSVSGTGLVIDDDRAEASFGQYSERSFTAGAGLSQVIFSEPAWANVTIQKDLQLSLEAEREKVRLDVALEAAVAYLIVLKTKTVERIQQNNVKLTRSNLEAAQVRQAVGVAGPAEVYRWEAEIAASRKAVIAANSLRNLAEIELNRILDRPSEESFTTQEVGLDDPALRISYERLFSYINNPWSFDNVRDFLVEEGLEASPELAQMDALIAAAERVKSSASRAYWSPTLALQGDVSNLFWEDGAGADFPTTADDTNWSIGVNLTLPIYSGGSRRADYVQAREELEVLRRQRDALADRIEQRIRSALHLAGSSFAAIALSRSGAEAADKSLEVVSDAYGRGTVSILELLDAQNTALVSDRVAANAIYDFLIDYMNIQRAIGSFDVLATAEENRKAIERLEKYLEERGALPSRP
jgi:outer membrane protein TolC